MKRKDALKEAVEASVLRLRKEDPTRGTRTIAQAMGISRNRVVRILRRQAQPVLTRSSDGPVQYVKPTPIHVPQIHVSKLRKRPQRVHCIIPDVQVKPGVPTDHLHWIGNYIAEKRPDVIVQIGDFADMPSLSSYSLGQAEAEGNRYVKDIQAAQDAMDELMRPIRAVKGYEPEMILTLGNHEDRIDREAEANPRFMGAISTDDLRYAEWGWNVKPFLQVVRIDGWEYSHYFVSGAMGRPVSSAAVLLRERQRSAVMGHVQYTDIAFHKRTGNIGIFCGICYQHDEKYLTPQGNTTRRQIVMLHEVHDGVGDPMLVSLAFLKERYS